MKIGTSHLPLLAASLVLSTVIAGKAMTAEQQSADPETVVRALYAAFEHGDIKAVETLIAPDATWTYYGPPQRLPFGGKRVGPDGVRDFFAKVDETLENPVPTQRAFLVSGEMVAVPGTEESTVKRTGIRYRANNLHLFRVHDGKIVSFEEYIDSGKVLLAFQGDRSVSVSAEAQANAGRANVDKSVGKATFTTCAGCHGNDGQGRPSMAAPNLAGQNAEYLARQLNNFRTGKRGKIDDANGFQMVGRATAISAPNGVEAVATYIANLPGKPAKPITPGSAPAAISNLVETCASCHGARGEGNPAMQAPAINRLSRSYIAQQLVNFRTGKRGYHSDDAVGAGMAAVANAIPDQKTIDALADYYGEKR